MLFSRGMHPITSNYFELMKTDDDWGGLESTGFVISEPAAGDELCR